MVKTLLTLISLSNCVIIGLLLSKPVNQNDPIAPPTIQQTSTLVLGQKIEPIKKPEVVPVFVNVIGNPKDNSIYADIMSHSTGRTFGDKHGRMTNAHETTHFINSQLRESHMRNNPKRINAFYVLGGKGVVIEEPNIKLGDVANFVPQKLRSHRYQLYLVDQRQHWEDYPLYVFDEWVAYVNSAKCGLDDINSRTYREGWTDGVYGCLDFSIFSVGLAMAVESGDPEYWKTNTQFKSFLIWHLKEANKTYMAGHKLEEFKWEKQDRLLNELLTSPEGAPMREFMKKELEGVWLDAASK